MERITWEALYMEMAHVMAKRSTCMRLNVAALVVKDHMIISSGYNGAPSGQPHCPGESCPGWNSCHVTIHAEDNALQRIPVGETNQTLDMYCTDSPCARCWDMINQDWRIVRLYFRTLYRVHDHLLAPARVRLFRVLPSGAVIDWRKNTLVVK